MNKPSPHLVPDPGHGTDDQGKSLFVTAQDGLRLHVREYGTRSAPGMPVVCLPGLARSAAEGDQRVSDLHLTSKGEELLGRVETAMVARITELCDKTPDGHQLLESLAWMGMAIDHSAIERPTAGSR